MRKYFIQMFIRLKRFFSILCNAISIRRIANEPAVPMTRMNRAALISTKPTDVNLFARFSQMGFLGNHFTHSRAISPFSRWKRSLSKNKTKERERERENIAIENKQEWRKLWFINMKYHTVVETIPCTDYCEQLWPSTLVRAVLWFHLSYTFHHPNMFLWSIYMR